MLQDILPTAVALAIVVLFGLYMRWRRKDFLDKGKGPAIKQKTTGAKRSTSYLKRVK